MTRRIIPIFLAVTLFLSATPCWADQFVAFKDIKIFDNILVFVDVDGEGLTPAELKVEAVQAFKKFVPEMELNDDAWVENYPAEGYTVENVGYIIIKVMSIRTESGMNVYHLNFETGIPPRLVYWDTATMGVAPTTFQLKKEISQDINEVMELFAKAFHKARGQ